MNYINEIRRDEGGVVNRACLAGVLTAPRGLANVNKYLTAIIA